MVRSKLTIFPESSIKTAWDCVGFIFIVIQSIMIPFNISFGIKAEGSLLVFDTMIDIFFLLDISKFLNFYLVVINLNSGFYRKGVLIMSRKEIIINYLRTWYYTNSFICKYRFALDLLASFPYSWFINFDDSEDGSDVNSKTPQLLRLLKFMRFIRILRLLRVLRL